jgi:hypothetical protein
MKEIIIIEAENSQKVKEFLAQEQINYQTYQENEKEEEIYRRDMRLANQDKERQKEIKFWDKIQDQDNAKLNKNDDE